MSDTILCPTPGPSREGPEGPPNTPLDARLQQRRDKAGYKILCQRSARPRVSHVEDRVTWPRVTSEGGRWRGCESSRVEMSWRVINLRRLGQSVSSGTRLRQQLESVAKISNLHYIEAFQCIGNPIHWNASIYWVTNTLKCFNILGYQYIEMLQYIANYLFLQRTLTVYGFP